MSGKNPKYNKPVKKTVQKPVPQIKPALPDNPPWLIYALLGGILLATFWCYHYTLSNQFTNWDDGLYIYENPYIKNLSSNLHQIIFTNAGIAYYHPLTMLTLALNWKYWGSSPESYYVIDVTIHLLNTLLVFFLVRELLNAMVKKGYGKIKGIPYLAGLCALLHGIHPMHVESVSWIAERKDVFYLFFYLVGLIMYVRYIQGAKFKWMIYLNICLLLGCLWGIAELKNFSFDFTVKGHNLSIGDSTVFGFFLVLIVGSFVAEVKYKKFPIELFYICEIFLISLFSKPMAVVFPLALFPFDILLKRKIEWRLLLEKIPLFAVSILSGVITYISSDKSGSITSSNVFTLIQKLSFVGVNYLSYLGKYFVPVHLCSYYPYPELTESNGLPFLYYLGPFLAIAITLGLLYLAYKAGENYFRVALFGFGFYFFNVMFILQFISAGPAIMADRYSYAAYLGVSFILVYFIYVLIDKIPSFKTPVIIIMAAFSCMLAILCQARTEVWHNTKTLWQDVIKKYPATVDTTYNADRSQYVLHVHPGVETSYKNLGNYYVQDKNPPDYDSAYMSYVVLEQTKSKDAGVYSNLGNIWAIRGNIKKSLEEYTKSLSLNNKSFDTYLDRAITYSRMGIYDSAMRDFNHAYKLDSTNQKLFEQRGYTLLNGVKDFKAALADYNRLINIDPTNMEYYRYRGLAQLNIGDLKDAMDDFTKVINANPKDMECLYFISFAYNKLKSFSKAIEYAQKAQQGGYKLPAGYIDGLQKMAKQNGQ